MKILLFAGAGTSIELGVPGMEGLAAEFLVHAKQADVEADLAERLMGGQRDVEYLIEHVDRVCAAIDPARLAGLDASAFARASRIRAELEWFVQHAAERVAATDARLMWGPVIQAAQEGAITFVTTNYDRAIELAASAEGVQLDDGFVRVAGGEAERWRGFQATDPRPVLVKLHGSTNWYADVGTDSAIKLRHPMPLFGGGTLLFEGHKLGSAVVLPSREKMLTKAPYPRMSQMFLNVADQCDVAIFVGSSLRDSHVRDTAQSSAERVPVFIVNPDGDSHGVADANVIAQTASHFLVSTLPNALAASEPTQVLCRSAQVGRSSRGCLIHLVRELLNPEASTGNRCAAIDELDSMGATLPTAWICQLLEDPDSTVARYALGLIATSSTGQTLIEAAGTSKNIGDVAYNSEYEMLLRVMGK